jgi:N-acetyl-anhydromuramyl-L-alanine amidase AmpD
MAKSPEYPDLPWVPPRSYTWGRSSGAPRFIVIHTTEGSAHGTSAEDGAAYDARRTDQTSTHYFVDSTGVVQCVKTTDTAHTAGPSGNRWGIQYELCGRASYDRSWWLGDYGRPMLRHAAAQAARDVKRYNIPVKRITPVDLRNGGRGFVGHVDVTNAWGEVDHTDPGKNFPWAEFLTMVNEAINPASDPVADEGEDDMTIIPFQVPEGFAYTEEEDFVEGKLNALSIPLPAVGKGHASFNGKALFVSLSGDHEGTASPHVRVAIHNGAGWTVKTVIVPSEGGRVGVPVPAAANDKAYKITVGRVDTGDPRHETVPLGLLIEIL